MTAAAQPEKLYWRITALRLLFAMLLPLMIFSRSAWADSEWAFEIIEQTGVMLIFAAVLGRFWAILYSGGRKNAEVVQTGPYSICRHPLYLFSSLGAIGFGLMLGSLILTAIVAGLLIALLLVTARKEEANMTLAFGDAYTEYKARTPMIIPDFSKLTTPETIEAHVGSIRRTLFDAFVFMALIPLAEVLEMIKENALIPTFPLY